MTALEARLRLAVYRHFADTGRAPDLRALVDPLESTWSTVSKAALRLHDLHALVLGHTYSAADGYGLRVRMAHPFAGEAGPYVVQAGGRDYPVNCAWDALSLPPLLGVDGVCESVCPASGAPLRLEVREGELVDHGGVVRLGTPARHFWDDIGFT